MFTKSPVGGVKRYTTVLTPTDYSAPATKLLTDHKSARDIVTVPSHTAHRQPLGV